jgi:hypothetical protein
MYSSASTSDSSKTAMIEANASMIASDPETASRSPRFHAS